MILQDEDDCMHTEITDKDLNALRSEFSQASRHLNNAVRIVNTATDISVGAIRNRVTTIRNTVAEILDSLGYR